ncbi:hypothetical protein DYB28_012513, partial [Aphanomyces astaci]
MTTPTVPYAPCELPTSNSSVPTLSAAPTAVVQWKPNTMHSTHVPTSTLYGRFTGTPGDAMGGDRHKDALQTLWILLTASTLHLIWTEHNKVQYEDKTPLPPTAWNELSFLGWTMSVRRWLRLQDPDCPLRSSVLHVLHTLRAPAN